MLVGELISFVDEVARRIDVRVEDENVPHQSVEAVLSREQPAHKTASTEHTMHASQYTTRTAERCI